MSNKKVFCSKDDIELIGDERDVILPIQYKMEVLNWCRKNNVIVELPMDKENEELAFLYFGVNLWRIKNDKQRMLFILRWS